MIPESCGEAGMKMVAESRDGKIQEVIEQGQGRLPWPVGGMRLPPKSWVKGGFGACEI